MSKHQPDMPPLNNESKRRFWAKVEKRGPDACWLWTGAVDRFGRGKFYLKGYRFAPRVMLAMHTGATPPANIFACHSCDNPTCVNPAHLWWGDRSDNMKDCGSKGRHGFQRHYRGPANPNAKLSEADVRSIRVRHANGEPTASIAKSFSLPASSVWRVATKRSWTHVE